MADELSKDPLSGDKIFKGCYKVRMAISSKGKGKRGGARIISYVLIQDATVFLLTVYDKSERENIDDSEILELIRSVGL